MTNERRYPRRFVCANGKFVGGVVAVEIREPNAESWYCIRADGCSPRVVNGRSTEMVADSAVAEGAWREVFDHHAESETEQLRTQLADARRIISELQAAQGIAVHELNRQRELAAARLRHINGLTAKLKKAGIAT
jgi:hypothetical protein